MPINDQLQQEAESADTAETRLQELAQIEELQEIVIRNANTPLDTLWQCRCSLKFI